MNYSENTKVYGRKIVNSSARTEKYEKYKKQTKRILISWMICLIIGSFIGSLFTNIFYQIKNKQEVEAIAPATIESEESFMKLDVPLDEQIQQYIYDSSIVNDISYSFVIALIDKESTFRPKIISKTNDYGLMQINTCNHSWLQKELGITDFLDPYQNIDAGIYILTNLFDKYQEPGKVLMAYNLGENGAKRLWDKGIFETKYSKSILELEKEYSNAYNKERGENND